jgi:hypothetical protein
MATPDQYWKPTHAFRLSRGGLIAMLILCGYYSHAPYQATLRFFHRDQVLAGAEIVGRLRVGESVISGSERVSELLYRSNDPRFARFRAANLTHIQAAQNYVAACSSEEGLSVDGEICRKIGGRVHAATVTAAHGFKWVPGFEPVSDVRAPSPSP